MFVLKYEKPSRLQEAHSARLLLSMSFDERASWPVVGLSGQRGNTSLGPVLRQSPSRCPQMGQLVRSSFSWFVGGPGGTIHSLPGGAAWAHGGPNEGEQVHVQPHIMHCGLTHFELHITPPTPLPSVLNLLSHTLPS